MKTKSKGTGLLLTILVCAALFIPGTENAPAQNDPHDIQKNYVIKELESKGAYVNRESRFGLVIPNGFRVLSFEEVKALVLDTRKKDGIDIVDDASIKHTILQPMDYDAAMRKVLIVPGSPYFQTLQEFERAATPSDQTGDFVYHARENITINKHPGFLLDREFDAHGFRFRQIVAFIIDFPREPGQPPSQGFNLVFSAVSVNFEEYKTAFMECLNSFTVIPPDLPPGYKESKYSKGLRGPDIEDTPAWRTPEVIGSLIFVGIFVIWFLVKKLSAGVEEEEEKEEQEKPEQDGEGKDKPEDK
jgi:hypothetical protein